MLLRRNSIQKLFNGYEYDIEQLHHAMMQDERKKRLSVKQSETIKLTKGVPSNSEKIAYEESKEETNS